MLKNVLLIISLFFSLNVFSDEITLKDNAPTSYIVKKGDTLWDISGVFLQQPWLWPKLWRLNPEINNPHLIYPGDELNLVFDEKGEPMLVKGKPELKWSPKIRTQLKDLTPVNTLPLNIIAPYIKYDSLLTENELATLPYVLGSDEGYKSSIDGFNLYINGHVNVGKGYAIYHKGKAIEDPITGENLGFHVQLVGTAKGLREGDIANKVPATLYVDGSKKEIRSGDYVLPIDERQMLPAYFTMQAVNENIRGMIINSSSEGREFGKLEVVMINKGEADSISQGDVLTVKRQSPGVLETGSGPVYTKDSSHWNRLAAVGNSDYKMPEESLGKMMVFRVYEKVSMALILHSQKPLRLEDIVTAP